MSETGTVSTSDQAVQASSTGAGGTGGDIRVEAAGDIVFGAASIQAKGADHGSRRAHRRPVLRRGGVGCPARPAERGRRFASRWLGRTCGMHGGPRDDVPPCPRPRAPIRSALAVVVYFVQSGPADVAPFMQGVADNCSHVFCQFLNCEPTPAPFQFSEILPPGVTNIASPGTSPEGAAQQQGRLHVPAGWLPVHEPHPQSNSVDLKWDVASQPGAAFQYTMTWQPELRRDASTGLPDKVTRVAWYDAQPGTVLGQPRSRPGLPEPEAPVPVCDAEGRHLIRTNRATVITVDVPASRRHRPHRVPDRHRRRAHDGDERGGRGSSGRWPWPAAGRQRLQPHTRSSIPIPTAPRM